MSNKKKISWEILDLKELFDTSSEEMQFDEHEKPSIFHAIIQRYIDRGNKMHIMHTNFNQSINILKIIGDTDGVEFVYPVSRYKSIITFGKLFEEDDGEEKVKKDIRARISKLLYPNDIWKQQQENKEGGV